jgi:hypothetical protein
MREPHIIVQFVGFQSKNSAREYTFTVREPATEPREYTISIPNEAFDSHRARYQDAPDICSHKLHRELAASENHPADSYFRLTNAELEDYRSTHAQKPPKYPYAPKPVEEDS